MRMRPCFLAVLPCLSLLACDALTQTDGAKKPANKSVNSDKPDDSKKVAGDQTAKADEAPGDQPAKTDDKAPSTDTPKTAEGDGTKPKSRSHLAQKTTGKAVKLEQAPAELRKAFWTALNDGRKQTAGKQYEAAIAAFDLALTKIPDHPRALSGRGYAKYLAGKLDEAEADFHKALSAPGTHKLEAAIAFNLGLVAEKRGDTQRAHGYFSLSNTLRPTKAAKAKIEGDTKACPVEVVPAAIESELYENWQELWSKLAKRHLVDTENPPKSEAEARKAVCTSEDLTDRGADPFPACESGGPWLVKYYYDDGAHALVVIETADADQLRLTFLGEAGGGRCGADSKASITGDFSGAVVHWEVNEYVPIDVMYNDDDEIVDCTTDECFTACADEQDSTATDFIFHPFNADTTIIRSPTDKAGKASVRVTLDSNEIVLKSDTCEQRMPVRDKV